MITIHSFDSFYSKAYTVQTKNGFLAFVRFRPEAVYHTKIDFPEIILLPRDVKEFVMDSKHEESLEILAGSNQHRCISGPHSRDSPLV